MPISFSVNGRPVRTDEEADTPLLWVLRDTTRRYLGGELSGAHIWVRGDIRAGRFEAVRSSLMLAIMKDVSTIAAVPEASIWVYLCNLEPTDMVEFGHVLPAPGDEQAWFERLPPELQTYLTSLSAKRETFQL